MNKHQLQQAIDACRPGSEDIQDPRLIDAARQIQRDSAALRQYETTQKLDSAISEAFIDVPTPEALDEKILARLDNVDAADASDSQSVDDESAATGQAIPPVTPASVTSRRRFLAWTTGAAVAVAATVAFVIFRPGQQPLGTPAEVASLAIAFHAEPEHAAQQFTGDDVGAPPEYPLSTAIVETVTKSWRPVDDFLGKSAVAYDMTTPPGGNRVRATLYVIQAKPAAAYEGWPAAPLRGEFRSTRGMTAWAWREGDSLYVLVIDGGPDEFPRFVGISGGPIT